MLFDELPIFKGLATKMSWLTERQKMVSRNLSVADIPGEKAYDLKPLSFKDMVQGSAGNLSLTPVRTNVAHLEPPADSSPKAGTFASKAFEVSPNGNSIDTEQQLFNMNDTNSKYALALNLYRKNVSLVKTAIGKPTG
jgi:flagellar basal-body rod protein FlgB